MKVCLVNVADKETCEVFPHEVNIGKRIAMAAEKHGLRVRPRGNLTVLSQRMTMTRDEVDELVSALRAAMKKMIADLQADGAIAA